MTSTYFLKLPHFEGPLDLLLHLIRENEFDVFDIDILALTNKYLDHLRLLEFRDLAEAGEFLEMAATLIEIKSRMLLPIETKGPHGDDFDDDDPRHSLQQRLIDYERFRAVADYLSSRPQLGVDIQTNHEWSRLEPKYEHIEAPLTGEPATLVVLFEQMLRELSERKPKAIVEAKTHMVTVEEKIKELTQLLERVNFALFQGFYKKFQSRYELVVYILAVLELVKWSKIKVYQRELLGPLWLYKFDFDELSLPLSREERERIVANARPDLAAAPIATQ